MSKVKKDIKEPKIYNFGEREEEYHAKIGKKLPVWQSPKYIQSKSKAIELIENGDYGLDEGDFWILMNATKSGKMMYTGLIISHNGCLKINDKLENKMKFKPSSVEIVKDEGDKVKVMRYINDEQGVYEFGEISPLNCKNDYPYAMVLKRLMDRVILKNSKVGFFGIYSDSESEDFKQQIDSGNNENKNNHNKLANIASGVKDEMDHLKNIKKTDDEERKQKAQGYFQELKKKIEDAGDVAEIDGILEKEAISIGKLETGYKNIHNQLTICVKSMKELLDPANLESLERAIK